MRAIVYRTFGSPDQLRCEEVETPKPDDGEILVRVRAASVNPLDWHMLRGTPRLIRLSSDLKKYGTMRPGRDAAGEVVRVGSNVARFRPGDRVFGASQGAFAEFLCGREDEFVAMPDGLSFDSAAALPIAGLTALQALRRDGRVAEGARVLIIGASGGVGTFAVQLAHRFGAEVTAVCRGDAAALVSRLGASRVVDREREDVATGGGRHDLIVDLAGAFPYRRLMRLLPADGRIVAVGGGGPGGRALGRWMLRAGAWALASRFRRRKLVFCMSKMSIDELAELGAMAADGRIAPVIDRSFALEETAEAVRRVAEGRSRGKVLVRVAGEG